MRGLVVSRLLSIVFQPPGPSSFPGKSLFYMKPEQAHYRRWMLQRWIQKIAAQPLLLNSETFQTFLLNAQKEVQQDPEEDVQIEIFLANGKSVKVDIVSTDQTDDVLETVCVPLWTVFLDPKRSAATLYFSMRHTCLTHAVLVSPFPAHARFAP